MQLTEWMDEEVMQRINAAAEEEEQKGAAAEEGGEDGDTVTAALEQLDTRAHVPLHDKPAPVVITLKNVKVRLMDNGRDASYGVLQSEVRDANKVQRADELPMLHQLTCHSLLCTLSACDRTQQGASWSILSWLQLPASAPACGDGRSLAR